jgi:quercetin dioxygenase-like cupin family protein
MRTPSSTCSRLDRDAVAGAEPVTVKAGEGFYEGPNDVHIVGRSASDSKPAKFVVVLVKKQGVPALLPAK